jgi:hypothetical protein
MGSTGGAMADAVAGSRVTEVVLDERRETLG